MSSGLGNLHTVSFSNNSYKIICLPNPLQWEKYGSQGINIVLLFSELQYDLSKRDLEYSLWSGNSSFSLLTKSKTKLSLGFSGKLKANNTSYKNTSAITIANKFSVPIEALEGLYVSKFKLKLFTSSYKYTIIIIIMLIIMIIIIIRFICIYNVIYHEGLFIIDY